MNYQRRTGGREEGELWEITISRKNDSGSFDATLNFSLIPRGIGSMPLVAVRGKANRDSKSAWTERKITVSANIYPATRGGNVRLDSDSELISFEIPSSIYPPTSSTSATHSSPSSLSLSSRIVVHHPRPFPSSLSLARSLPPPLFLLVYIPLYFPLTLTPSSSLFLPLFLPLFVFESHPGLWRLRTERPRAGEMHFDPHHFPIWSHLRVQPRNGRRRRRGEKKKKSVSTGAEKGGGGKKRRKRKGRLISRGNATRRGRESDAAINNRWRYFPIRAPFSKFLQFRHPIAKQCAPRFTRAYRFHTFRARYFSPSREGMARPANPLAYPSFATTFEFEIAL